MRFSSKTFKRAMRGMRKKKKHARRTRKQRGGKLVFPYTGGRPESASATLADTLDWDDQKDRV